MNNNNLYVSLFIIPSYSRQIMSNNNTKTKVFMIFLSLSLLLFVFPQTTTTVSIQKAYAEANVIVTPTCGPDSGFSIKFDATGFSPNGLVHWKLIRSDGSEEMSQFGSFETNGNGGFSESSYIEEELSPDVYKVYFFDDLDNDSHPDPGRAEFLSTISIPCGYGIQQNETLSAPSVMGNNNTTADADASTLSDNTTRATGFSTSSDVSPFLSRNQTSKLLSNQSSTADINKNGYETVKINSDPLLNRSNNGVTTEANILGGNTTLSGMDNRNLITYVNNASNSTPNQILIDNIAPNLEGLQEQQQILPQQLQKQEQQQQEQLQQLLPSPPPTPIYPKLSSQQNQSSLPSSTRNIAEQLPIGGNEGQDIGGTSAEAGTSMDVPTTTTTTTTPIPPAPFQELLPSPPSLSSPIITVQPSPPSPPATTPIPPPAPFQQQLSVTESPLPSVTESPIPSSYPSVDTTPPDTIITSAIDNSTGLNVVNGGGITAANSITLIFEGIDDSGITGYSCTIDNLPTFTCLSPVILDSNVFQSTLGIGSPGSTTHTFQVSATDIAGNTDLTPAIFNWFAVNTIVPTESSIPPQMITPQETTTLQTVAPPPPLITPETIVPNTIAPQIVTPQIIPQTPFDR
jgi:hypothetical protein